MTAEEIAKKMPVGYYRVDSGPVKQGDLFWAPVSGDYMEFDATSIGTDAKDYFVVARPMKGYKPKDTPTTIEGWLNTLPDGYRERALKNTYQDRLSTHVKSLHSAIMAAFGWKETPEGCFFWGDLHTWAEDPSGSRIPALPKAKAVMSADPHARTPSAIPEEASRRKEYPIHSGLIAYFPDAVALVANLSYEGNKQHHPDKPLHWDRDKSTDHLDALQRHNIGDIKAKNRDERIKEKAKKAWRALADLQDFFDGKGEYAQ